MPKIDKNRGITLIALVVTVIVLLILAAITIGIFMGEDGIISKATKADVENRKAEVKEKVEMEVAGSYSAETGKQDREELKRNIVDNLGVREENIKEDDEGNLRFPLDGFNVKVDKDGKVEVTGNGEEEPLPPDLQKSDIGIDYSPTGWTPGPVKVTLTKSIETSYKLQYSTSRDSTWKDYEGPFEVSENNTEIYVRLINNSEQPGGQYATGNIETIDRLEPSRVEFTNDTPTTNSVVIRASADDAVATDDDGCSGIAKYYYSINGPDKNETTEGTSETFHEFTGLKQGETYTVQVTAEDEAENQASSTTQEITIGRVTDLQKSDIGIDYSPTGWTPGPVKVTLTKNISTSYKLQYSTSRDATWRDYEKTFEVSDNNTEIYVRLVDGNNQPGGQYATGNVETIDRLGPSKVECTNDEPTTNSVVIRASAEDAVATDDDGCSGIAKYYYSINGPGKNETTEGTSETFYEFTGLKQGETYTVQVTAEDGAKNQASSTTKRVTIGRVTDLQESNIGIDYNPEGWTQGPVTITLTKNIETSYKLQYSTSRDSTWRDYEKPFEVSENNTEIYVRLVDGDNQPGGKYATGNVETIDRLGPSKVECTNDEPTTNSVVIRASADDAIATDDDGCSGIAKYYYSINGPDKNETTEGTSETFHEFTGLKQGETYQVTVTAEDEAKNQASSTTKGVTIGRVTDLQKSDIGIDYSPTGWTQGPVTITLTKNIETSYKLQYSTSRDSTWRDYEKPFEVSDNNTEIYVRLVDGDNQPGGKYATGKVDKIDRLPSTEVNIGFGGIIPNSGNMYTSKKRVFAYKEKLLNDFSDLIPVSDAEATDTNGCSGIAKYYFSNDDGLTWYPKDGQLNNDYIFEQKEETTYYYKIKVVDEAGNEAFSKTQKSYSGDLGARIVLAPVSDFYWRYDMTIHGVDEDEGAMAGLELRLYKVCDSEDGTKEKFYYTSDFEDCGLEIPNFDDKEEIYKWCDELENYIIESSLDTSTAGQIDFDGKITFGWEDPGLYIMVASDGYCVLPWRYDVNSAILGFIYQEDTIGEDNIDYVLTFDGKKPYRN